MGGDNSTLIKNIYKRVSLIDLVTAMNNMSKEKLNELIPQCPASVNFEFDRSCRQGQYYMAFILHKECVYETNFGILMTGFTYLNPKQVEAMKEEDLWDKETTKFNSSPIVTFKVGLTLDQYKLIYEL